MVAPIAGLMADGNSLGLINTYVTDKKVKTQFEMSLDEITFLLNVPSFGFVIY